MDKSNLASNTWIIVIIFYGLIAGLIVNYFSDFLPVTRQFIHPECLHCNQSFTWYEYVTYARCVGCGKPRNRRSIIVQFIFPLAFIYLWFWPSSRLSYLAGTLLLIYLIITAIIDIEYRVVLHPISIAGGILCFILGWQIHGLWVTLAGGAAGYLIMLMLYFFGQVFSKVLAKIRHQDIDEVALGFGDVNLGGVLGLLLGWPGITVGLLFSILLGGLFSAGFIVYTSLSKRYKMFTAIPYAPFLIFGAIILLYRP